jgi:alkylated DNA nucleotide flippase Atl1
VPWHRVVNAKGRISARNTDAAPCNQRCRLTEDGVVVTDDGRVESFPGIRHVF